MVCHLAVEVDEHPRGGVVNDSGFDRLTGERANGLERFPPRDDGDLDGRVVGDGQIGPVAKKIGDVYFGIAHGDDKRHSEWRTAVYR